MNLLDRITAEPNVRTVPARYLAVRKITHEDRTQTRVAASALLSSVQRFAGRDQNGNARWVATGGAVSEDGSAWSDFTAVVPCKLCPGVTARHGGHVLSLVPVKGRRNLAKTCNARCEGATGPQCECSCGGDNHGQSHGLG